MRKSKVLTLSLPSQLSEDIKNLMEKENLTRSELIREALRFYLKEKEKWEQLRRWGEITRKRLNVKNEADIERIIDQIRK